MAPLKISLEGRLKIAVTLFALISMGLNVLCNPFSPAYLVRLIHTSAQDSKVEVARDEADISRAVGSEHRSKLVCPPDIDDVVAVRPKTTALPLALSLAWEIGILRIEAEATGIRLDSEAVDRESVSVLCRLCRLRC